ncbi:MAG: ankyrin repeat domain-containing protein [Granulosicoccus sp.]|nr:ankyrin repeat domain-containing protein [Granulosicoccus sp.]
MISPGSRLAVIIASLIVTASGYALQFERPATQRLSIVRLKFGTSERQAWISAINNDSISKLSLMIEQFDPHEFLSETAENGKTALMSACKKGDLDLARRLLDLGADVNAKTQTNGTPFMFAVLGGHLEVARSLLDNGADIHVAGSNGWTATTIAAAKGHVEILKWLVEQGADPQVRDVYRSTPLLRAVSNGFEQVAVYLLSLPDTDVDVQDESDNTPLHYAVGAADLPIIKLLVEHGADHTIENRKGQTPYAMDATFQSIFDAK